MRDHESIGLAVIGYGYWSPKLIRNILASEDFRLVAICEKNEARHAEISAAHPGITLYTHYRDAFADPAVRAVVVGTVISSHYRIAKMALESGKHVLVEKPLAITTREAKTLEALAKKNGLVLMVDHTYLYNPAIVHMRDIIRSGELGDILSVRSERLNLGLIQHDASVLYDLAPHDFSVIQWLFEERPTHIIAVNEARLVHPKTNAKVDSAADVLVFYSTFTASVSVSWLSPTKVRRLSVIGTRKSLVFDQLAVDEQLKLYDKGADVVDGVFVYRDNGYSIVELPQDREDLARVIADFARAVRTGGRPRSHAALGVEVVQMLEAAERSLRTLGRRKRLWYW